MGKTATNLVVILGLITLAFGGYYLYTQEGVPGLSFNENDQTMQDMLSQTRTFIQHRQVLDQIELDTAFFEDPRFRSLRSYTTPIEERPIGRPNPFDEPTVSGASSF